MTTMTTKSESDISDLMLLVEQHIAHAADDDTLREIAQRIVDGETVPVQVDNVDVSIETIDRVIGHIDDLAD